MKNRIIRLVAILTCLAATACNAPRGAGFESEILRQNRKGEDGAALPADFAIYPVTGASVPEVSRWQRLGPRSYRWIKRQAQPASLIIAPGDLISVQVWDTETNSLLASAGQRVTNLSDMKVSSSGSVFLPFVGEMRLEGMSPQSARARIEERYIAAIPSAQVQVSVKPGRANTADLVSGVARPGVYPLEDRDVSLLSLIAMGGGVQDSMKNPQVRLFRGREVYGISMDRLFEDPGLDTTLAGGDRVIVEPEQRFFLSLGAAGSEAEHIFPRDQISALEAMSIIGGVSDDRANPKGILVLREYPASAVRTDGKGPPQSRMVFTMDLTTADGLFSARNFEIMPRDLVYVSESPVTTTRTILGLIGSALGIANRVN
jgi:polysaccharide export outer membrane protein